MDTKPKGEVFYDDYEMRASRYIDEYKKQKEKNPNLLKNAALEYKKSINPEGKEIAQLCIAWYYGEQGKKEKNDDKACIFLLKSATAFRKDKRTQTEAKNIMLQFYKRKLAAFHSKGKRSNDLFLKRAKLLKELGNEKHFNIEMSMYYFNAATNEVTDLTKAINLLEKGIKHAEQSGFKDMLHKMQSMLHKFRSHAATSIPQAIKEIEEELISIEKTSDKYGRESALGDLRYLNSLKENEPEKKLALLEEAADFYNKGGLTERAHTIKGGVYQRKARAIPPEDTKHGEFYLKASEEYGKAGNVRMQKWLLGHYEVALATTKGVLADNNKEFKDHLLKANHYYGESGNIGGTQFTAGIGIFLEAIRADYPDSIKLLEQAAACLFSIGDTFLSAFAMSEVFSQKAAKAETKKERIKLMHEEKNHLERAVIEADKKLLSQTLQFPVNGIMITAAMLDGLNKARLHELHGFLESDYELRKKHFQRAKAQYLSLESNGAFKSTVLAGIGWSSLFIEDISEAKKYFEKLKDFKPNSHHVKLGLEAIDEFIKVKYSQESTDYLIQKRLSVPMMVQLLEDVSLVKDGKPYPSDFFNVCLAIVRDSCTQIERYRKIFLHSDEPSLRSQILMLSNGVAGKGIGSSLTGETFTGEGKSDILAISHDDNKDYFICECKIWKSVREYMRGFKQLTERYQTATDKAGVLINFVKKGLLKEVLEQAVTAIKELDPDAIINPVDDKNFVSTHKNQGIIFHHFVDIVESDEKIKKKG